MVRVFRLDGARLGEFMGTQLTSGGKGGGELLAEGLDALGVQDVLPALRRLLSVPRREPLALLSGPSVTRSVHRRPASARRASARRGGEPAQGEEVDDAGGARRACAASFPPSAGSSREYLLVKETIHPPA